MKKALALFLALTLLLTCACAAQGKTAAPGTPEAEDTAAPAEPETPFFRFTADNFPRIDGSTASKPLAVAAASVLLGIPRQEADSMLEFHKTTQSFRNLTSGECDILIAGEPQAAVFEEMEAAGFSYELEEVATDALIFVVNAGNPVDNLTTEQLRDIYSGKITNWKEVGGNDEEIVPFQRNEGAGSQALMLKHIMKDTPIMDPPTGYVATEMGELMEAVRSYDNSAAAIGYSVYYYANDMKMADGLKILSVDGVAPSDKTIQSREYPHLNAYYSLISADAAEDSPARILYNWLMSKDGQALIAAEGYVAAAPDTAEAGAVYTDYTFYSAADSGSVYTRLTEASIPELAARDDYGLIFPFAGSPLLRTYDGEAHASGYLFGFADQKGRLVCDPVYSNVSALTYYDGERNETVTQGFWILGKTYGDIFHDEDYDYDWVEDHSLYAFASFSGDVVSPCIYSAISATPDYIIARDAGSGFSLFDLNGNFLFSDQTLGITDRLETFSAWSIEKKGDTHYIQLNDGLHYSFTPDGALSESGLTDDEYYSDWTDEYNPYYEEGWYGSGRKGIICKDRDNGVLLKNTLTGVERLLEGIEFVHPFYTITSQAPLPYLIGSSYAPETYEEHCILLNDDLETVFEGDDVSFYAAQDEMTVNWFIVRRQGDSDYVLMDENLTVLTELPLNYRIFAGWILEIRDDASELHDIAGKVLFRYPFTAAELE